MLNLILTRPTVGGGSGSAIPGLTVSIINGQPMLTLEDTTRANKILSVSENPLLFSENQLSNLDWIRIGNANDADSGYTADFNGTITFATGHCENTNANSKDIRVYVNGVDSGSLGVLAGGSNVTFINTTLDLDFNQGDIIRLRAIDGLGGPIQDTVIKLVLKWRG